MAPKLATAIIGAGPAGLLFGSVAALLARQRGVPEGSWVIKLYDKRTAYARTHRLKIAPEAWEEVGAVLQHPAYQRVLEFLREEHFAPEVNVLEERLQALAVAAGLEKEQLCIGAQPGESSLSDLRRTLEAEGHLGPETTLTVVAADSVHSTVRELVRETVTPERRTHEQLARLRVSGAGLPRHLTAVDQVRLSKVLGSVVDYRLNSNGFAEVDLFLTPREHEALHALHATPREPIALSPEVLGRLRTPFFRAIVEHLQRAPDGTSRSVSIQSTFRLEHVAMPRVAFRHEPSKSLVFLVGDAALSLPFQRGMSALARCALALANVHLELLTGPDDTVSVAQRYDAACRDVLDRELRVVRSRARLVGTLRELVRVSALLPFPIQSWWLRAPEPKRALDHVSLWFVLNLGVALTALVLALGGFASGHSSGAALLSLVLQALGGAAYSAALAFEGGPHRLVRRLWEGQVALLALFGVGSFAVGVSSSWSSVVWWLVMGGCFAVGLILAERATARWFANALLTPDATSPPVVLKD